MTHPKHILVGTDLSTHSLPALDSAATFARSFGAKVTLVHVFDPAPLVPPAAIPRPERVEESIASELHEAVVKELETLRKKHLAGVEGVQIEVIRSAAPAKAIIDLAENKGVDLIVVGTHGRTGIAHMLIGSVAERVVRHAHCAVLAVRSH